MLSITSPSLFNKSSGKTYVTKLPKTSFGGEIFVEFKQYKTDKKSQKKTTFTNFKKTYLFSFGKFSFNFPDCYNIDQVIISHLLTRLLRLDREMQSPRVFIFSLDMALAH